MMPAEGSISTLVAGLWLLNIVLDSGRRR